MTTTTRPRFAKEDGTARKNLYHSHLVRAANGSGVMLKIKSEPRESKFPKPNLSHYVYLQFPDDDTEYSLSIEDETLEAWQKAPTDVWIMAHPSGSADTPAEISFTQAEGHRVFHDEEEAAPQDGPPPMWPDDEPKDAPPAPRQPDLLMNVMDDTERVVKGLANRGIEVDSVHAIFATLYIQASKR